MIRTFLSKRSSPKRVDKPPLNLGALRDLLSISFGQFGKSGQSEDSISELLIRSSRVSLYLLGITTILDFPSASPNAYLSTLFWRIMTIRFWRERGVLAQVFPKQVYTLMKQIFSIGNIIHQLFAYQSSLFELMVQTEWHFFSAADSNYPNTTPYLW